MTIEMSARALVNGAAGLEGVADEMLRGVDFVQPNQGLGSSFGELAADVHGKHDEFAASMFAALHSATTTMHDLAQALRDTAKDFGVVDDDVADRFHNPDGTPR